MDPVARRIKRLTDRSRYRQVETGVLEESSNGIRSVRVNGRSQPYTGVGATWLDSDNSVGDDVRSAFADANPLLPVFFDRSSRPGARKVTGTSPFKNFFSGWFRRYARPLLAYFLPTLDDPENPDSTVEVPSSTPVSPSWQRADIVRVDDERTILAKDSTISIDGEETALAGEIQCTDVASSGRAYSIVQAEEEPLPLCEDAFYAGYERANFDFWSYDNGQVDCEFGYGWDPDSWDVEGEFPAEAPYDQTEELVGCWNEGAKSGHDDTYYDGFRDAGCEPPEWFEPGGGFS